MRPQAASGVHGARWRREPYAYEQRRVVVRWRARPAMDALRDLAVLSAVPFEISPEAAAAWTDCKVTLEICEGEGVSLTDMLSLILLQIAPDGDWICVFAIDRVFFRRHTPWWARKGT